MKFKIFICFESAFQHVTVKTYDIVICPGMYLHAFWVNFLADFVSNLKFN